MKEWGRKVWLFKKKWADTRNFKETQSVGLVNGSLHGVMGERTGTVDTLGLKCPWGIWRGGHGRGQRQKYISWILCCNDGTWRGGGRTDHPGMCSEWRELMDDGQTLSPGLQEGYVSVCPGGQDKMPRTRGWNNRNPLSHGFGGWRARARALFGAYRRPPSCCVLTWQTEKQEPGSLVYLLVRTGTPSCWTSPKPSYIPKAYVSDFFEKALLSTSLTLLAALQQMNAFQSLQVLPYNEDDVSMNVNAGHKISQFVPVFNFLSNDTKKRWSQTLRTSWGNPISSFSVPSFPTWEGKVWCFLGRHSARKLR